MDNLLDDVREAVRKRYAAAAGAVTGQEPADTGCCSAGSCAPGAIEVDERWGAGHYGDGETDGLPAAALAASLGCGNPLVVADLRPGERVLDLGSGGGIDVLLSARRVGPTGFAYGVDMTDEMLDSPAPTPRRPARRTWSSGVGRSRCCRSRTAASTSSSATVW
jgi:arsenite methyltransferase